MARNRTISPDFWTTEAVIDCASMTRLLFLGLQNFADDGGVQPLRPRTIRMQVFPGDAIENHSMRAMIDELAAQGLVRTYEVDGVEYVAIVDWEQLQRVGKRAKRRYPSFPSPGNGQGPQTSPREEVPSVSEAVEGLSGSTPSVNADEAPKSPPSALRAPCPSGPSAAADLYGEKEEHPPPQARAA